jgi:hypothetical protein
MKIKVISYKNPLLWYSEHIGQEFEVHFIDDNAYWCREKDGVFNCLNWIAKEDATITEGNIK